MNHLGIEALLALREPGSEPGEGAAREHLDLCAECRAEFDRIHQRIARLRALPPLRPGRDRWGEVRARVAAERRRRQLRRAGWGGLAAAASVAAVVATGQLSRNHETQDGGTGSEIVQQMERSRALEGALYQLDPETRVLDGRTAQIADELEDRIAAVDRQLEAVELLAQQAREERLLRLWRERVGLLDALVDVHVTRASNVGL